MHTAVQLYSLRALDEPLAASLSRVATAGFDGVEFAGLDDSLGATSLDEAGLDAAGAHVGAADLGLAPDASDLDPDVARRTADRYLELGVDTLVVPILDEAAFADEASIERTAGVFEDLASAVPDECRLCYHNHEFEFRTIAGRPAWERLVDATEAVGFELDLGWAHAAGYDPVELLERYGDRIPLVHLKDVSVDAAAPRGGRSVDLGEGDLDVEACRTAARTADVDWLVFEHDEPSDPVASLGHAAETLGLR